jgi:DNA-binding CsgD family transcriptional regulator
MSVMSVHSPQKADPWTSARQVLARADALLETPVRLASGEPSLEAALADAQLGVLAALREATIRTPGDVSRLADTLTELVETRDLVRRSGLHRRMESGEQVRRALTELRAAPTAATVMDRAVKVLCTECGFDRAFLFRVENAEMVIDSVYFTEDPGWAKEFQALATLERPQLTHQLLETEMIRRRAPVIIRNAATDPRTFKPLVLPVKTTSYVAAPVMPNEKIIGFLHADCYFQGREVDEIDRDTLWTFAEGFGFAVDRAVLIERLNAQRGEVRRLVSATNTVLNDLCDTDLRMTRTTAAAASISGAAASTLLAPESRMGTLLTRREAEVIALMAEGATNSAIARSLVISQSTVKSHVKHLMRKLRATNRAEAVARYHRILSSECGEVEMATPFGSARELACP